MTTQLLEHLALSFGCHPRLVVPLEALDLLVDAFENVLFAFLWRGSFAVARRARLVDLLYPAAKLFEGGSSSFSGLTDRSIEDLAPLPDESWCTVSTAADSALNFCVFMP